MLLVQVHAIWEHFLDITHFNRHIHAQVRTVNVDPPRIDIIEAPDPHVRDMMSEVATRHEMQRFLLLSGDQGQLEQVWSSNNVPLELDIVWLAILQSIVDILTRDADLLFGLWVHDVPWTDVRVVALGHAVGRFLRPDKVDILELVTAVDNSRNCAFLHAVLESISRLAHP